MDEWKLDVDKIVKAGESYDAHAADLEKILGQKQEMEININVRMASLVPLTSMCPYDSWCA